jgi:hypothetical protein
MAANMRRLLIYAELDTDASRNGRLRGIGRRITGTYCLGRSIASNLSGGRKRPRRSVGGTKGAMASSFSVGSALR